MKDINNTLIRLAITEKASQKSEQGVYVFEVPKSATKTEVNKAVKGIYKVTPVKISTVTIPQKRVVVRGKRGKKAGYKKAYVYLKKGEKIDVS